jgi:protein-L-isoaspartate O-methyltransferase
MVFARLVQLAEPAAGGRALLVGRARLWRAVLARLVASVTALESDPAWPLTASRSSPP